MTTRMPSLSRSAGGRASHDATSSRERRQPAGEIVGQRRDIVLVGEIERRLDLGGEAEQLRLPDGDLAAERAAGQGQSGAALRLGLGFEQVGEPLRLGEVDPAVLEGAAGELARLGGAQALDPAERRQHRRDHRAAAMEVKLGDILPGRAAGPGKRMISALSSTSPPSRNLASVARRGSGSGPGERLAARHRPSAR